MGYPTYDMTFNQFQERSKDRATTMFPPQCMTPAFLAVAISGESGEMCNLVKKVMRGDYSLDSQRKELLKELADIMTYCDLFMTVLEANTGDELAAKFDEVSKRRNYPFRFTPEFSEEQMSNLRPSAASEGESNG
jgi:NTP pyrophosphatase (non-canonical NTP hydrolase)